MERILPIGSVIKLKRGDQKLMIITRTPLYNNQGTIGYFDYSGCIYPIGQIDQQMYFFNEEDIEKIYFEGYRDESEEEFCNLYKANIKNIKYPKLQLQFEDTLEKRNTIE